MTTDLAREGVVRDRNIDIRMLVWTLVGLRCRRRSPLNRWISTCLQHGNRTLGRSISFYDRFTEHLADLLYDLPDHQQHFEPTEPLCS